MSDTPESVHLLYIRQRIDEILEQTTTTNGRVRKAEIAIAVLQWAYGLGVLVIGWLVVRALG